MASSSSQIAANSQVEVQVTGALCYVSCLEQAIARGDDLTSLKSHIIRQELKARHEIPCLDLKITIGKVKEYLASEYKLPAEWFRHAPYLGAYGPGSIPLRDDQFLPVSTSGTTNTPAMNCDTGCQLYISILRYLKSKASIESYRPIFLSLYDLAYQTDWCIYLDRNLTRHQIIFTDLLKNASEAAANLPGYYRALETFCRMDILAAMITKEIRLLTTSRTKKEKLNTLCVRLQEAINAAYANFGGNLDEQRPEKALQFVKHLEAILSSTKSGFFETIFDGSVKGLVEKVNTAISHSNIKGAFSHESKLAVSSSSSSTTAKLIPLTGVSTPSLPVSIMPSVTTTTTTAVITETKSEAKSVVATADGDKGTPAVRSSTLTS